MNVYEEAREYAAHAEGKAAHEAVNMTHETLQAEYVSLSGMVAYYTKLERVGIQPQLHSKTINKLLQQVGADTLIAQAQVAEEQGVEIAGTARVPAKALIDLLIFVKSIAT